MGINSKLKTHVKTRHGASLLGTQHMPLHTQANAYSTIERHLMLRRLFFSRCLFLALGVILLLAFPSFSAQAASIDPYIVRYLHITEPIALEFDGKGETRQFSPLALSKGKQLFESTCINCHVGGATLPNPQVSLSLKTLKGANPSRDNINALITFMRQPVTYDGSEETYWCRQVPESFLSQEQVENLAAFVLTAAQKAPGWGTEEF